MSFVNSVGMYSIISAVLGIMIGYFLGLAQNKKIMEDRNNGN